MTRRHHIQPRRLARLAGGDLRDRAAARARRHLAGCAACRRLLSELESVRRTAERAYSSGWAVDEGFRSIRGTLRGRLAAAGAAPRAVPSPLWPVLLPAAAVLALVGFFLVGGGSPPGTPSGRLTAVEARLSLHAGEKNGRLLLEVDAPQATRGQRPYRVAVSPHPDDFVRAAVFTMSDGSWVDSTPPPRLGQALFYRVD
ncbi:MAG: hypothetical protein ACE5HD_04290 [Acidobacteriota bacterium]